MNRILLGIFTVAICFAVGHTLQCYKCDIGIGDLCITSKVICNADEQCFSGVGKAGFISVKMKGCLAPKDCNLTTDVEFPSGINTTIYKMTKTCCSTDLCNSATRLPVLHTLPLLLCSLFVAKIMM